MEHAGALLVWSMDRPHVGAAPITADGLVLGRELIEQLLGTNADDRISRQHCKLTIEESRVNVADLESRNGTFLRGARISRAATAMPTVLRTGRSVWALVSDVRPYQRLALARRGRLVVGASLASTCRVVETAARDEANLLLLGPRTIGRELAKIYAAIVGEPIAHFDPAVHEVPLEHVLESTSPKTLVLDLDRTLLRRDAEVLASWLETDLRVVTVLRDEQRLGKWPFLIQRLFERGVEIPNYRYDELPTTLHDMIRAIAPADTVIHATTIERCLLELESMDEDLLIARLHASLLRWRATTSSPRLRAEDLDIDDPRRRNDCVIERMPIRPRARIPPIGHPPPLPSEPSPEPDWDRRRLCLDGACFGVIGADERCRVCGTPVPLDRSPYR